MLSGGSLPAVETGTMDTRRWSEAGRSAPAPAGRRVPTRRGRGDRVTGRLCARRRVSGASPSDPACSFQGLRPSARPPGARRRGHVTVCLLGPASSCPCLAGGKRWAWRSGACVATRPPWSWCCPLATGDPHGAADTGRLVLWNETPLSASLRQLRPRSFISEKKMWFC